MPDTVKIYTGESQEMEFTLDDYRSFKRRYNHAVKRSNEYFDFKDQRILTVYGKYVVSYLQSKFEPDAI